MLVRTVVLLTSFLGLVVPSVIPPLAIGIADSLRISPSQVGTLVGAQGLLAGVASLLTGPFSDKFGRKRILVALLIFNVATVTAFSCAWNDASFYLFGILSAVTFGPLVASALACAGDYSRKEERGTVAAFAAGAIYVVTVVGVPLGLALEDALENGWRVTFLSIAGLSLFTAILATKLPRIRTGKEDLPFALSRVIKQYLSFLSSPHLISLLVVFFLMRLGAGMYLMYGPSFMLFTKGLPSRGLMIIYSVGGTAAFFSSLMAGRVADKGHSRLATIFSSFAIVIAIFTAVYYPINASNVVVVFFFVCLLYMISESFRLTTLQADAVSRVDIGRRGSFLGIVAFLMAFGNALGAIAAGFILSSYDQSGINREIAIGEAFFLIVHITAALWFIVMLVAVTEMKPGVKLSAPDSTESLERHRST